MSWWSISPYGRTLEIAGDALTPPEIAETFGRVCGLSARFHPGLMRLETWLRTTGWKP
jgi:hypothetical protein